MRLRRSYDLTRDLTILFVCAVSTVLLTRSFLALAGYPQVGGSKFHIAHVLYGGLLLTVSCICLLAFLSPAVKPVAAVLAGVGFGLFIDEVGKFITKNVNYFYRPAFAIIYICFVVMFGAIRWLGRRRFTADEALLIGIDALEREAVGSLSVERRALVLELMRSTDCAGTLAADVERLLEQAQVVDRAPGFGERIATRARALWDALIRHPRFRELIFAVLIAAGLISAGEGAWLLRDGLGHLTFAQKVSELVTIAADAMLAVGAVRLRRSIVAALHWYEHAVLLEILVGQVFLYSSEQLAASLDLFGLLIVWSLLHWGIHFERAKNAGAEAGSAAAPAPVSA